MTTRGWLRILKMLPYKQHGKLLSRLYNIYNMQTLRVNECPKKDTSGTFHSGLNIGGGTTHDIKQTSQHKLHEK